MEAIKDTRVSFMDVVNHHMCFGILYKHLDQRDKATLRLVCKELRDAVNLNARGLEAVLGGDYEPVDISLLISKLPNLENIAATVSFYSEGVVNVFQGAQLARKLTKLELQNTGEERGRPWFVAYDHEERERRAEVIENSFGTIRHNQWPLLQSLKVRGLDARLTVQSMKGLLRLSTLTKLELHECAFNNESFNLIQPDSWPCLRHFELDELHLEDPTVATVAIRALLHLTGLEELSLKDGYFVTGEALAQIQAGSALAQIQPGSWPHLQVLDLYDNVLDDDPVGAVKGLLHLTALTKLCLASCGLTGEAMSQIKPGDWPQLQELDLFATNLSDNPVREMYRLLRLTALTELHIDCCNLTGEAISQIKPGDWPQLQKLDLWDNNLDDDPVGAMKALMHLTGLEELFVKDGIFTGEALAQIQPGSWPKLQVLDLDENDLEDDPVGAVGGLLHLPALTKLCLASCELTGEAISQIMSGDWPQLQELKMSNNSLDDDPVGAMNGLLRLSSLTMLNLAECHLNGEAISQIKPGDWPHLELLDFENWKTVLGERVPINVEDYSDDPVGAINGLMNLPHHLNIAPSNLLGKLEMLAERNDVLSECDSEEL